VQCILPQGQTTPERALSNPWYDKGFCEPYQYKAAIDRCKGGYESCDLFIEIFNERARIERNYANELDKWAQASIKDISQSKEFGTNKKAWSDSIRASTAIGKAHSNIAQRLQENVVDKMTAFKKEHYGKSILHIKKVKEFEHDFEQAQKSWIKLLDKINKAKKEYHEAHRQMKKAEAAEQIVNSDRGAEDDQKSKLKLSVSTHKKQVEATRSKYQQYINDMTNSRPNYENGMKEVLDRTHNFETKRLDKYKDLFLALHQSVVVDKDDNLAALNESFKTAIGSHSTKADIDWWNSHYGSDTKTTWPVFEELKD